jgi:hypothetical protein
MKSFCNFWLLSFLLFCTSRAHELSSTVYRDELFQVWDRLLLVSKGNIEVRILTSDVAPLCCSLVQRLVADMNLSEANLDVIVFSPSSDTILDLDHRNALWRSGKRIFLSKELVDNLNDEEFVGLVAHELSVVTSKQINAVSSKYLTRVFCGATALCCAAGVCLKRWISRRLALSGFVKSPFDIVDPRAYRRSFSYRPALWPPRVAYVPEGGSVESSLIIAMDKEKDSSENFCTNLGIGLLSPFAGRLLTLYVNAFLLRAYDRQMEQQDIDERTAYSYQTTQGMLCLLNKLPDSIREQAPVARRIDFYARRCEQLKEQQCK